MTEQLVIERYRAAYFAVHADQPVIEPNGRGGFKIDTKTGSFDRYSRSDVENLTRGLNALATAGISK